MDFVDAVRVLLRRWRVIVVGLVAVAAAAGAAVFLIPTNYQAAAQVVLLLPSQATGAGTPTNPYLNLDPGLTVSASLIASSASTKDAQRSMKAAGFTSEYTIGLDPGSGPILQVSAEDKDPQMAVRTRDEAIRRLQSELAQLQADVSAPQRQLIQARTTSLPEVAEPLPGSKIRALAAIGGVGGAVTLLVAFLRDRRLVGLSTTAREEHGHSGPPPAEPEPEPEPERLAAPVTAPDTRTAAQPSTPREAVFAAAHEVRPAVRVANGANGHDSRIAAPTAEVQWWDS